jgi:RNA polymerase sigma factor (sigma-70 family)
VDSDQLKSGEAEVADLIKNFISSGDKKFWGVIFEKYKKNIFIQCFKILNNEEEAKDLTSEVFIRAIEKIHLYKPDMPLLPWLYGIAKHLCIDHIRRKQRIQFTQIENEEDLKAEEETIEDEDTNEVRERVKKAIDKLKRPQRTCFCLFYMQQKSYNEIAGITGYSYDEVRSHIQNGRRKFKIIIDRQYRKH